MKISELFYSIQGEGKRTGAPSFFIRTNFCNLRCKFKNGNLCDTPYTSWFPDDDLNKGEMSITEIISEYGKHNCRDVVITGGEPTMYGDELENLSRELKNISEHIFITIETNGTYFGDHAKHADLMSISPKLSSSVPYNTEYEKMHEKNRFNIESFKAYNDLKYAGVIDIQWKFVFTCEADIDEIRSLQKHTGFADEDVYLMPEGITREDLDSRRLITIETCLKNNFNYTDRLHIVVWGNKRGV